MRVALLRYSPEVRLLLVAAVALSILFIAAIHVGRAASPITVTTTGDIVKSDGRCSLREAITAANKDRASGSQSGECPAGSGSDTIILPAGTHTLAGSAHGDDYCFDGDLDITSSVVISPTGPVTITAASGFSDRIFHILGGNVTILNVTISKGNVSGNGGAIYVSSYATLNLRNSTLTDNTATDRGGAIYSAGTLNLTNVTINGNKTTRSGSSYGGGGLYTAAGTTTLVNTTVANNKGSSGGNLRRGGGTLSVKNMLVAYPVSGGNCTGALTSQGYNLSSDASCALSFSKPGDLNNINPQLGPLQDNGGWTFTQALAQSSPAIDRGTNAGCPTTDQRGQPRPIGLACDIGSYELQDPAQAGPAFTVNTAGDTDNGVCSHLECTLREAIHAANAWTNGASPDEIRFNVPGTGPITINLTSVLPTIAGAVMLDGSTQPGGVLTIDGANAAAGSDCLVVDGSGSIIKNLIIRHCPANGVHVLGGTGNAILGNVIADNGALAIELGSDGVTANDTGDADNGANNMQNSPVLLSATTTIQGRLNSAANTVYVFDFYANTACDPSGYGEGQAYLGSSSATTNAQGDVYFTANYAVPDGQFVTATATDPDGNTSEFSACTLAGVNNVSWLNALGLNPANDLPTVYDQRLDKEGQSRWYKFRIEPNSKVTVKLTGLPANYDLTVYKDISATFQALNAQALDSVQDLNQLGAEFAPDSFSPDSFSPDSFSPDSFSPDSFSPDSFSPDSFSPDSFSPDSFSADAFTPDSFSPDSFSPDSFSPDSFSPDSFSPDSFSPDSFSPDSFSPDSFSSAQMRSLVGVSAFEGTAGEGIAVNTWNNTGDYYVRVRGRNGAFDPSSAYHLEITVQFGACSSLNPIATASNLSATAGSYKTIILVDMNRLAGTAAEKSTLQTKLAAFAARSEVAGVIVDAGTDNQVAAANAQADAHPACPYAKNLVADAVKEIVDKYRALNPLEYVVIIGNDDAIPFFRHPDQAMLGNEVNYAPPVRDNTASQASLKLSYVLSQDRYGAQLDLSSKGNTLPVADLAVGRLVETAADAVTMLDAYLSTADGVVATPTSSLVTGYDFLADAADAVSAELQLGIGTAPDSLITARDVSPQDPQAWTAAQLRAALLDSRHDVIFLAGHFSANSALAADYTTRLRSADVVSSSANFSNTLIFSAGCHAGYNIVDPHGVSGVTREPDWAQTFTRKGATLIAGTGYQYGDTDFIEYNERLYLDFTRQLRLGSGPVAIGKALAAAKQQYLVETPQLRPIHEKAYLQATLFGLPMLSIDLPNGRLPSASDSSIVSMTNAFNTNPGLTLGLHYADVNVAVNVTQHTKVLDVVGSTDTVEATYFSGSNGQVANPAEPVQPLEVRNVSAPGTLVLRGAGFRGGTYTDLPDLLPLTGAATTELRGVHAPFFSKVWYPIQPWRVNTLGALNGGATRLIVMPAQFQSDPINNSIGTLRIFNDMQFRLYYSDNIASYANDSTPALAAAPSIVKVTSTVGGGSANLRITIVGNPAAGVQEAWATFTALSGPYAGHWQSIDLAQSATDSTVWIGSLPLSGTDPQDVRFVVQAVNGVGLVSLATNLGAYYIPGAEPTNLTPTTLSIGSSAATGAYGTPSTVSAILTRNGAPLPNRTIDFALGSQRRQAITDNDGHATVTLPLLSLPGEYELRASFMGTDQEAASSTQIPFTITRQATVIALTPEAPSGYPESSSLLTATLTDATGRALGEKNVFFVVTGPGGAYSAAEITDYAGRAVLGSLPLLHGAYTVDVYFSGVVPLNADEVVTLDDVRYTSSTATTSLSVLNHAPIANSDAYTVTQNTTLTVTAPGVLSNDTDADNDPLTASVASGPTHGTLVLNAAGSFVYTPQTNFFGTDTFAYTASDGFGGNATANVTLTVQKANRPPICSSATSNPIKLWPPNGSFYQVRVQGVTDPDNDAITITITGIRQDEPVGGSADAYILGVNLAKVRAERDGSGNGRVYHLFFRAQDAFGDWCDGHVRAAVVSHDQSNIDAIDGGPLYDSTTP